MKITSNLDEKIKDIDKLISEVESIEPEILEDMGLLVETQAKENVRREFSTEFGQSRVNVNTGNLAEKWRHRVEGKKVIVENYSGYAYNVEYGTKPGTWVPFYDLQLWFIRKSGIPLSDKKRWGGAVKNIQKNIFAHGILPSPFLRPAPRQQAGNVKAMIELRVAEKFK